MLSDSESSESSQESEGLKINSKFAQKYEHQQRFKDLQRAEELQKELDDGDDSESTSEDEDGEALSTQLDLQVSNYVVMDHTHGYLVTIFI